MTLLLLIPGLIAIFFVLRGRIETALLSVYLPCLLLLPYPFGVRIPHLPPFSAAEFVQIPLGIVACARFLRKGSYALMDALVVLYLLSISLSEILHEPVLNDGIFAAINFCVSMGLAYMIGRQLIEPDLRFATVRRIVILMLLNGPNNLYEWRMGSSPYGIVGAKVFGVSTEYGGGLQIRNGHGRVGTVFGGGESAGIAFAMSFCLNGWLIFLRKAKARVNFGKILEFCEKYRLAELLLLLYVFGTQSRGPELALGAGLLILQMNRFKRIKLLMVTIAIALLAGYLGAKSYFYSNTTGPVSEQQSSTMYRQRMNVEYAPIAEAGGWTGYSVAMVPHIDGMNSIDNQYLLVHLAWGRLAYYLFILIALENIRVLVVRVWQCKDLEDRAFILSMMAAMLVLWFTLLTVFLGSQLPQLSFLLLGWIQTASKKRSAAVARPEVLVPVNRFSFRRVFT